MIIAKLYEQMCRSVIVSYGPNIFEDDASSCTFKFCQQILFLNLLI